ncbi:methyltransferase domain-containing protein [Synechococcus sp. CS-1328]|uniref:methyltransferase domain-containing protein n=1 Tax=Synechococcus sp. CS-1328 TaxID=2847976 RepID=UPI00223C19BB|nr:methyltransferase domain-containing protein [Synechococcus sp. CS-1328]MCT0224459.1 methyltransferase domain-containing protein [Synechococcus sp. CS-1328]
MTAAAAFGTTAATRFSTQVRQRFAVGASAYDQEAHLQRAVAWRLAHHCRHLPLLPGPRADLGAGTGLLSRALLEQWPSGNASPRLQQIDLCPELLTRNALANSRERRGWDLERGLPAAAQSAALLISSFALQWLENPAKQLEGWCHSLMPGGWLALAVPTSGSFPQWRSAAAAAAVPCTALPLPDAEALIAAAERGGLGLRHAQVLRFQRLCLDGHEALGRMRALGAGASRSAPLSAAQLRRLLRHWKQPGLSWEVLLLLGSRPTTGGS